MGDEATVTELKGQVFDALVSLEYWNNEKARLLQLLQQETQVSGEPAEPQKEQS